MLEVQQQQLLRCVAQIGRNFFAGAGDNGIELLTIKKLSNTEYSNLPTCMIPFAKENDECNSLFDKSLVNQILLPLLLKIRQLFFPRSDNVRC